MMLLFATTFRSITVPWDEFVQTGSIGGAPSGSTHFTIPIPIQNGMCRDLPHSLARSHPSASKLRKSIGLVRINGYSPRSFLDRVVAEIQARSLLSASPKIRTKVKDFSIVHVIFDWIGVG